MGHTTHTDLLRLGASSVPRRPAPKVSTWLGLNRGNDGKKPNSDDATPVILTPPPPTPRVFHEVVLVFVRGGLYVLRSNMETSH